MQLVCKAAKSWTATQSDVGRRPDLLDVCRLCRPCLNRTSTLSWDGATTDTSAISHRAIHAVRHTSIPLLLFYISISSRPFHAASTRLPLILFCVFFFLFLFCVQTIPDKAYLIHRRATPKWTTPFHQIVTVILFPFFLFTKIHKEENEETKQQHTKRKKRGDMFMAVVVG